MPICMCKKKIADRKTNDLLDVPYFRGVAVFRKMFLKRIKLYIK